MQDEELWQLYTTSLGNPNQKVSDKQKVYYLDAIRNLVGGKREDVIKYMEHVKSVTREDAPRIGVGGLSPWSLIHSNSKWPLLQTQCPKVGLACHAVIFDNIKVFFHPVTFGPKAPRVDAWAFYIARPGASESQCIKWASEGIKILACGADGIWSECLALVVAPGARVRFKYRYDHEDCLHEIQFPGPFDAKVATTIIPSPCPKAKSTLLIRPAT